MARKRKKRKSTTEFNSSCHAVLQKQVSSEGSWKVYTMIFELLNRPNRSFIALFREMKAVVSQTLQSRVHLVWLGTRL